MNDKKYNIVVVGGGTAGWLTALFAQRFFKDSNVSIVDSSKLDVIGAGESTTPQILDILDFIGVSVQDMIKHAGATIKNSVRFTNWNGDGDFYHHGFYPYPTQFQISSFDTTAVYSDYAVFGYQKRHLLAIDQVHAGKTLDEVHLPALLSRFGKVPMLYDPNLSNKNTNAINHFNRLTNFALHFNARQVAKYLREIGEKRNIEIIDAMVVGCNQDKDGFIESIKFDQHPDKKCDFVFDCSGFSRVIIKKVLNAKLKSYAPYLPVKKAIPFFIDHKNKDLPTYTEAVCMKNGWMWKSPVEKRYGCGYVFDSDYISEDEAYKEVVEKIGKDVEVPKVLSFDSGYFETPWVKNCLSIGLASGFIEPLEATSIWISCISLLMFGDYVGGFVSKDQFAIDEYNKDFIRRTDNVLGLVHLHYISNRSDSKFWKEFKSKNQTPPALQEKLEIFKHRFPSQTIEDIMRFVPFESQSWYIVMAGNRLFDKAMVKKEYDSYNISKLVSPHREQFVNNLKFVAESALSHDAFLNYMRSN